VQKPSLILRLPRVAWLAAPLATALALAVAAQAGAAPSSGYAIHNLVSDQAGLADRVDPDLVNAWGLASRVDSPWWVANNATSQATVYTADGNAFAPAGSPLVVGVPESPTGVVANSGSSFAISAGGASAPALFLFGTEEGKILAWNQAVPPGQAVVTVDRSGAGAIYKGLALSGDRLYATDFHNGRVDVFDGSFKPVRTPGAFVDHALPRGFAPFGIQALGSRIFVTFAKQDAKGEDDVHGPGLGFVDAFDRNGRLLARVARRGGLNAPWGIADAPRAFGRFSSDLLIGNFGDGRINAFRQRPGGTFTPAGELRTAAGRRLVIDGLWALQFGHGAANNGPANMLFFTAGPDDEAHGLFGTITAG
jgi:uncharacterized protein (TIGR03118 family)